MSRGKKERGLPIMSASSTMASSCFLFSSSSSFQMATLYLNIHQCRRGIFTSRYTVEPFSPLEAPRLSTVSSYYVFPSVTLFCKFLVDYRRGVWPTSPISFGTNHRNRAKRNQKKRGTRETKANKSVRCRWGLSLSRHELALSGERG